MPASGVLFEMVKFEGGFPSTTTDSLVCPTNSLLCEVRRVRESEVWSRCSCPGITHPCCTYRNQVVLDFGLMVPSVSHVPEMLLFSDDVVEEICRSTVGARKARIGSDPIDAVFAG